MEVGGCNFSSEELLSMTLKELMDSFYSNRIRIKFEVISEEKHAHQSILQYAEHLGW